MRAVSITDKRAEKTEEERNLVGISWKYECDGGIMEVV